MKVALYGRFSMFGQEVRSSNGISNNPRPVKLCIMRVYHRTTANAARHILVNGFRDGEGTYMTAQTWRGVWVSDRVLDESESAFFDTILTMDVPADVFEEYEWVEDLKPYRESLIPADILNAFGRPSVVTEEEE